MTLASSSQPIRVCRPRPVAPGGRAARALLAGLAAGLGLFHATLLWQRLDSLTLLEPMVAARWGGALLLLAGLVRLKWMGVPLLWGRQALVFWLLVALLHAGAVPVAEPLWTADPSTGWVLVLSLSSFYLLIFAANSCGDLRALPAASPGRHPGAAGRSVRAPGWYPPLAARPPPA